MQNLLSSNTIELVSLALDAALMRQTAIANNIANSNLPGYQALSVNFEQQLNGQSLDNVQPFYEACANKTGIDDQLALSVSNATQYRALIKGLNHKLAIMNLALQGNNQ